MDEKTESIVREFYLSKDSPTEGKLMALAESLQEFQGAFFSSDQYYKDNPGEGLEHLTHLVSRAQALKHDPTGFELADNLIENCDVGYNEDDPEYSKAKNAYDQAALHYKIVYNLFLEHGATADVS